MTMAYVVTATSDCGVASHATATVAEAIRVGRVLKASGTGVTIMYLGRLYALEDFERRHRDEPCS